MKVPYLVTVTILWSTYKAQTNRILYNKDEIQPWSARIGAHFASQVSETQLLELLTSKRNEPLEMAFERLGSDKYVDEMLAISWLIDFKNLAPDQKLITKKGIQDILFEAQRGKLQWDSVAVNEPQPSKVCEAKMESTWVIPDADNDVDPNFPCIVVCKGKNPTEVHGEL